MVKVFLVKALRSQSFSKEKKDRLNCSTSSTYSLLCRFSTTTSITLFILLLFSHIYVASSKCHHPNEMYTSRIVCVYDKIYNLTWVYFSMAVLMLHDSSYVFFSSAFRKRPTKFRFCTLATPPTSWCACVWRKYWLFRFFSELVWRASKKYFHSAFTPP